MTPDSPLTSIATSAPFISEMKCMWSSYCTVRESVPTLMLASWWSATVMIRRRSGCLVTSWFRRQFFQLYTLQRPLGWGNTSARELTSTHRSIFPWSKYPSVCACFKSLVSSTDQRGNSFFCRVEFPQLFPLFHSYLGGTTGANLFLMHQ